MSLNDLGWTVVETAWGWVGVVGCQRGLVYAGYPEAGEAEAVRSLNAEFASIGQYRSNAFEDLTARLSDYFSGRWVDWTDLPVLLSGTPYQVQVYEATRTIAYGQTATYGEIAGLAGRPRAARGAGAALAANRAGLLVPCHRIVASNGIGGYGFRPERKRALLAHGHGIESPDNGTLRYAHVQYRRSRLSRNNGGPDRCDCQKFLIQVLAIAGDDLNATSRRDDHSQVV
jgi:methylated-DNA-[protein]-cysteine S-methyltransferase